MLVPILETFSLSLLQSYKRPQTSESRFSDQNDFADDISRQHDLDPMDELRHKAQPAEVH